MPDPVPPVPPVQPPPPAGLINAAPGSTTTTPGASPPGAAPGSPVTGYNPAQATAATAGSTGFEAKPFEVAPNATVASQLKGIIDAGSPLMQAAEANARGFMNRRGLINSSQAETAERKAVIETALPIATADAATFDRAATNTTTTQNRAAEFGATAQNTAGLANAAAQTQTNQFNAGQQNAALDKAATASNTVGLTAQKGEIDKSIADLQADTQLTLADKAAATQELLANIQKNTTLAAADKQAASQQAIAGLQAATSQQIAQLQADTTLTEQARAAEATKALAALNNTSQQEIARIQADTSLSIADKQAAIQQLVASMNNSTSRAVQELQNAGSLANIRANGEVSTRLQILGDQNKLLLQNNAGAAQIYNTKLQAMSQVMQSVNMNADQKNATLNNLTTELSEALGLMAAITGTPAVQSTISYSTTANPDGSPGATAPANDNTAAAIDSLYRSTLGRAADQAGLNYWKEQVAAGMPLAQVEANMRASDEYKRINP